MMNNKGINLISLVIIIIIMIILAAIVMKNVIEPHDKSLIARAREENLNVTTAVQNRYGEYVTNPSISPLAGLIVPRENETEDEIYDYIIKLLRSKGKLNTQDESENKTNQKAIRKLIQDNKNYKEYTRILEHSHLVELGLESLPVNATFVVNYYGTDVVGPIY